MDKLDVVVVVVVVVVVDGTDNPKGSGYAVVVDGNVVVVAGTAEGIE